MESLEQELVRKMILEYKNPRNDGYVAQGFRDELLKIKELIEEALK